MYRIRLCIFLYLTAFSTGFAADMAEVELYFSPNEGTEMVICKAIDNAEEQILVAAYSFSSKPIASALYRAAERGVLVKMILDRKQPTAHYSMANNLMLHGLDVRIDRVEPLMHMKTMILDGKTLIAGSYNFTASAERRNAEIVTIIISEKVAAKAAINWIRHWNHSTPHALKSIASDRAPSQKKPPGCSNGTCPLMPSNPLPRPRIRRKVQWSN